MSALRRPLVLIALLLAVGGLWAWSSLTQAQGAPGPRWECSLEIGGFQQVCAPATKDGLNRYVTDIIAQSQDLAADRWLLAVGLSDPADEGCLISSEVFLLPSSSMRLVAPANTEPPLVIRLDVPLRVPPGKDLCANANQAAVIHVLGYLAP